MQTLREQGFGEKAIVAKKGWKLTTVKKICQSIDLAGSAVQCQPGNGRPAVLQTNRLCYNPLFMIKTVKFMLDVL